MLLLILACAPASTNLDGSAVVEDGGGFDGGFADGGSGDGGGDGGDGGDGGGDGGDGGDGGSGDGGGSGDLLDITLTLDPDVVTMVDVSWTPTDGDEIWVEYRFEGGDWQVAPKVEDGGAVLLGVPSETEVEARLAVQVDAKTQHGRTASITTGSLPAGLPLPTIEEWDEALADPAGYAMISVAAGDYTYEGPYWIEIFDRSGRVVWYWEVPDDMFCFYPTIALDGSHIWYEAENIFGLGSATPSITRRTLDGRWSTSVSVPGMGQAAGEGPDDSFFFEMRSSGKYGLSQVDADGDISTVWDCGSWMRDHSVKTYYCYMNTTNWSESHNSVLTSMFYSDTVFEIDLDSGEPIRQMGQLIAGDPYDFSPAGSVFDYQHNVYWLDEDTLLASTHRRGEWGVQIAAEYDVDDDTMTLTRGWYYESTDRWATQVGEALRLENGNTVQGYGQDGAVREVTDDGDTAWEASWEKDREGYRVVGHFSLIDDLYALNVGGE